MTFRHEELSDRGRVFICRRDGNVSLSDPGMTTVRRETPSGPPPHAKVGYKSLKSSRFNVDT